MDTGTGDMQYKPIHQNYFTMLLKQFAEGYDSKGYHSSVVVNFITDNGYLQLKGKLMKLGLRGHSGSNFTFFHFFTKNRLQK